MTDDLAAFLRERLTEDEQAARAVEDHSAPWDGQWVADGNDAARTYNGHVLFYGHNGPLKPGLVAHVARHDPARVLREAESKRRVLEQFETSLEQSKQFRRRAASGDETDAQKLQRSTESIRVLVLLKVVETLALAYRDHPDYRPEWAPDA